jgi:putative transposase
VKPFVDAHRQHFGVEPICKALQVAPSAYWREAARQRDPTLCPPRLQRDAGLLPEIERVFKGNMSVYGADKVWRQLKRERVEVARCTVERLMRRLGLRGAMRGKGVRTTVPDAKAACPLDRVNRQFRADRPNQLWVSDFTYVSTWQGFVYVAFVIDVYARRIVGWRVSASMHTDFVLDALEQALCTRQSGREGELIHHSDRGSQYVSIRYSERLAEAGIEPSVGSKGDSYDNALAETINGLYKAELIHRRGPWKTREAVELATLEWVSWFNHHRLLEPIGYIPPAEAEANYWRQQQGCVIAASGPHRAEAAQGVEP